MHKTQILILMKGANNSGADFRYTYRHTHVEREMNGWMKGLLMLYGELQSIVEKVQIQ